MSTSDPSTSSVEERIIVVSSDGRQFPMDLQMIAQSATLHKLVVTFGYDRDPTKRQPIPVDNVSGETMEMLAEWMDHFRSEPPYVEPTDKNHLPTIPVTEWDRRWLKNLDNDMLFKLINAANFLNIGRLYDALSKKVANLITGKTAEQIRVVFGIKEDSDKTDRRVPTADDAQMETDNV